MLRVKCTHCNLEFNQNVMIKEEDSAGKSLFFCCGGCSGVYHLLKDENLDSFYEKRGNKTIQAPIEVLNDDLEKFDQDVFHKSYVKDENGFKKVNLIVEGIHCAACIWLNEKVLYDTDGILEVSINFSNNKAIIIWDDEKVKLSQIIKKIRSIGYNAYAYNAQIADVKAIKAKREYFIRMMVAVFASMNIMMLSVAKYTGFFTGISENVRDYIHIGEFLLCTPVLFYSGYIFFKGAYFGLRNRILNMDFLVSSGATLTYLYSLYILFGGKGESYFDSVTMIITFVLLGKYLEVLGKKSAVDTLDKIKSKLPLNATLIKDNKKSIIAIEDIQVDDILELKDGEKVSVDGVIIKGESSFDESSITGESKPVYKKTSDLIYSGTMNMNNLVHFRVLKTYEDSSLNTIVTLLEDSLNSKPDIEHKANEISKNFSLSILILSFLTFIVWYFFGLDLGFSYDNSSHFEKSFIVAISVIVIACPCALALATPIASLIGVGTLAKKGLLFKEAKYIEELAKSTKIVLDKTGTLTQGKLSVLKMNMYDDKIENLELLYALLDSSSHPISKSVKKYLLKEYISLENKNVKNLTDVTTVSSKGLRAKYTNNNKDFDLLGGNIDLMKENSIFHNFETKNSVYLFAINKKIIATFELEDKIKDDAKDFVESMTKMKIDVIMLTGDNEHVALDVASLLGIKTVKANMSALDKSKYIKKLREEGHTVVMAGDGINDAIALSCANVGISMGNGSDIAIWASDIILLNNSLNSLKNSFIISKRTYKFIKQNLAISLVYNILTIPLAMAGLVIPLVAALSMSLSSLLVVANSLRIKND